MSLLQFTVADYLLCFGMLIALTINRWLQGGWMPVSSGHCSVNEEQGAVISPCPDLQDLAASYGLEEQ